MHNLILKYKSFFRWALEAGCDGAAVVVLLFVVMRWDSRS